MIDELLDENQKDQYLIEYNSKRGQIQQKPLKKQVNTDGQVYVSTLISDNLQYITVLFDILNLNIPKLSSKVWHILQLIPRNREIYQMVEQCLHHPQAEWDVLLDTSNTHRLLYNLQILKELLECDILDGEQ